MFKVNLSHSSYIPVPERIRQTENDYCIKAQILVMLDLPFAPAVGMLIDSGYGSWTFSKVRYSYSTKTPSRFWVETEPTLFTPHDKEYKNTNTIEELEEMHKYYSTAGWDRISTSESISVSLKRVQKNYVPATFQDNIDAFLAGSTHDLEKMFDRLNHIING